MRPRSVSRSVRAAEERTIAGPVESADTAAGTGAASAGATATASGATGGSSGAAGAASTGGIDLTVNSRAKGAGGPKSVEALPSVSRSGYSVAVQVPAAAPRGITTVLV